MDETSKFWAVYQDFLWALVEKFINLDRQIVKLSSKDSDLVEDFKFFFFISQAYFYFGNCNNLSNTNILCLNTLME